MNNGTTTTACKVQADQKVATTAVAEATLTPAFLAKVEKTLANVQYIRTACGLLGIACRTFYHWKSEGAALRDEIPLDQLTPRQRRLVDFCNAVERGIALGELRDLDVITQASRSNWRAAAWRLERRAPQRWGDRRQTSKSSARGEIKQLVAEVLTELFQEQHDEQPEAAAKVEADKPKPTAAARATIAALAAPERLDLAALGGNGHRGGIDALVAQLRDSVGAGLSEPGR